MKKLIAWMLAALLALSCVGAAAEEALPDLPDAMTIVSQITVNDEMLPQLLGGMLGEDNEETMDLIVSLVNNLGFRAVAAGNAMQGEITLKDGAVVTFAGSMDETGLILVSDLFPNYALTVSGESIAKMMASMADLDMQGIMNAVMAHVGHLSEAILAKVGQAEMGEWEFDGYVFTVKAPLNMTALELVQTEAAEIKDLLADEAIAPLAAQIAGGVDVAGKLDELVSQLEAAENPPEMEMNIYSSVEHPEYAYVTAAIAVDDRIVAISGGAVENVVAYHILSGPAVYNSEDAMREAAMAGDGEAVAIDFSIVPSETGMIVAVDTYSAQYVGCYTELTQTENGGLSEVSAIYYVTDSAPLLVISTDMVPGGEITADLSGEGKTAISLKDMMEDQEGETIQALMMDVMSYGLNNVLANAAMYMPDEVIALMNLMNPPAEEEVPAEEEAPAVEEADEEAVLETAP